ncbi:hypothetical protein IWW37_001630 [Coemansia sp. RSA 2050]|nr:hypothetical protein IWW37_001630 [Coemansia sp. RSA 2050]KAJ2734857.1 hypothetical protein IW152_001967 [Coemansia sp. BCRC 34962]
MAEKFVAKAHHAYTKAKPDEIDLSPGDILRVTNNEHEAWWVGTNESTKERGWFPSNFVKVEAKSSRTKTKRHVRCIKQYVADEDDEDALSLKVGDIVEVGRELEGWYFGTVEGRKGLFPASHVEDISGSSSAKDAGDKAPPPVHRPLPVPPVPSGAISPPPLPPTMLSRQAVAAPPPALPQRQPPLPPRASTDIPRSSDRRYSSVGADEAADDGTKKDKQKSGHRISRLFGTKKYKNKDAAEPSDMVMSPQAEEPLVVDDGDHEEILEEREEAEEEISISPAPPSRPLPQPTAVSPPASARPPLPPIPSMSLAKPPTAPVAAIPPPPAAAVPATPQRPPSTRRLSASSVKSANVAADVEVGADKEESPIDEVADEESEPVAESADDSKDSESTKPRGGSAKLAKIIEDYEAQQQEELNLMSGDVVTIISRGTEDDPRWKGEYHGKKGYFPANVVEAIEESADLDEEEGESGAKPKGGFRLAAYGVQQGGIGSIFAGGGLPSLRKAAPPRKTDEDEAQAAVPALAPVIPKLRSVQRPPAAAPKDEPKEEQVNFLAHLNRVPRRQTSSIPNEDSAGSPLSATPAAAPPLPLSRRSTAANAEDPAVRSSIPDIAAPVAGDDHEKEVEAATEEAVDVDETPSAVVPELPVDDIADTEVLEDEAQAEAEGELQPEEADAEELAGADEDLETSSRTSSLDPVKSPALAGVKRLVRRAPRQKPTAEGLKKQSEESQSQSLHTALKKDKDLAPEPEPEPVKAAPPVLPEKPRGLARHGQFSGPQLPTGGFKPSGRVGSAMASRLAALQARASGGGADEEDAEDTNAPAAPSPSRVLPSAVRSPPTETASSSSQAVKKPASFNARTESHNVVSPEWQRQIEDEQARLRGDIDAARRNNELMDQLSSRLAASERENMAHKQTISGLERQIESLAAQFSALQSSLSGIQHSVTTLESSKGVTASEATKLMRDELKAATRPLQERDEELQAEAKVLHKSIADLRAYVDELVVEEEQ